MIASGCCIRVEERTLKSGSMSSSISLPVRVRTLYFSPYVSSKSVAKKWKMANLFKRGICQGEI